MAVNSGTKACYGAAAIYICSGFMLAATTTGILLVMLRNDPNIQQDYWLTAAMMITFSFSVLSVGIILCTCAIVRHWMCNDTNQVDEESPEANVVAKKKPVRVGAAKKKFGTDEERLDPLPAILGLAGRNTDTTTEATDYRRMSTAEPDDESELTKTTTTPWRYGSADPLLPGTAHELVCVPLEESLSSSLSKPVE
ncbi:hypothetical protein BIW11_14095 [Tropilaelaps mercedesae]|uniref:Transmembrane protein n=1 Tax=Tropilaelaps mercedesae TaxID=418985 RepID=A0A1V9WZ90_9ACAR|nr:hypothetical protein BIW11_14095 [Tropilaelaps mercedesae]